MQRPEESLQKLRDREKRVQSREVNGAACAHDLDFAQIGCVGALKPEGGSWIEREIKPRIQMDDNAMLPLVEMSGKSMRAQLASALSTLSKGFARDRREFSHEPFSIPHSNP
jgi:hypothetical protein